LHRIGKVADIYRPVDSMTFPKEFALVGFYHPEEVQAAIRLINKERYVNNIAVTAEEAKQWLLDLYPKP
jgi:RNA recognition motif-containing protein